MSNGRADFFPIETESTCNFLFRRNITNDSVKSQQISGSFFLIIYFNNLKCSISKVGSLTINKSISRASPNA